MITEHYGDNFWKHPVIQKCINTKSVFIICLDDVIIRRHAGGMWCIGTEKDSKHFHSSDLERAILKAFVYMVTGEEWYKQTQEWKK